MNEEEKRLKNRQACLKWREKNREQEVRRARKYAMENRDRVNETNKRWQKRNPEKLNRRSKQQDMYWGARSRAKKLGLEFNLDMSDVVIPEFCPVLGIPLDSSVRNNSPSLDRINNLKGYVKGNVAVISIKANRWKNDMSIEDCKMILNYMEGKSLV